MDYGTLLADFGTDLPLIVADVVPIGILVLASLAGLGIALGVLRKFGIKR